MTCRQSVCLLLPSPPGPDTLRCPSSRWPPTGCPPCQQTEAWPDIVMSVNNWEDTQSLHSPPQNEPCPGCWRVTRENNCPAGGTERNPDCCPPSPPSSLFLTTRRGRWSVRPWRPRTSSPVVLQLLQREDVLVEILLELLVGVIDVELFKAVDLREGSA